jgi:hypothetical protein
MNDSLAHTPDQILHVTARAVIRERKYDNTVRAY